MPVQEFYLRRRQLTSASPAFIEPRAVPDAPAPDIVIELPLRERVRVPREPGEDVLTTVLRAIARAAAQAQFGGAA